MKLFDLLRLLADKRKARRGALVRCTFCHRRHGRNEPHVGVRVLTAPGETRRVES